MTFDPAQLLPSSAIELRDDDGKPVCTIYGRESGIEIVCQAGYSALFSYESPDLLIQHLGVTFERTDARRRGRTPFYDPDADRVPEGCS